MRVAFYGIARQSGTSANMAAVEAGLSCYRAELAKSGDARAWANRQAEAVMLTDYGNRLRAGAWMDACDLLALNLSIPCLKLDEAFLRHFLSRRNVLFFISKYSPGQSGELEKLTRRYRIERSRICPIPYNPRFIKAYENHTVPVYLAMRGQAPQSYGDLIFEQSVKRAVGAIYHYGNRKGE